ncbi:MAG: hypothetical protein Aurels2KO_36560 [Aureliella sp.]
MSTDTLTKPHRIALASFFLFTALATTPAQAQFGAAAGGRDRSLSTNGNSTASGWLNSLDRGSTANQWTLGIIGQNTDAGVVIQEVAAASPAARARLKVGDIIVSVGGYQVGFIGNQIFDVTEEINLRATSDGRVNLLVQDSRSSRLAALRVTLQARHDFIRGRLSYNGGRLPSDAVVTLKLDNLTRPHYRVSIPNNTFPASQIVNGTFQLPYDPAYIESDDVYELRAFVSSNGRTVLASDRPQRVITRGNPREVQMELVSLERFASTTTSTPISAGYPNYNQVDDRITSLYQQYLDRPPAMVELIAWRRLPANRINTAHLDIMASQEFFDLAGNNSQDWIERVFSNIVGERPSAQELSQWLLHYDRLDRSRMELLNHLSTEAARARR